MLGKFQTERKYCYAFHTTLLYSLKNFTFSLQAHAYGPRIAVLFWNTETCYSSKRTCPVKWILLSVFSLTWQPISFIYEGFFVIVFISNPPPLRFWGTLKPFDMLTGIIWLIWSFVLSIKFYSLDSVTNQKKKLCCHSV